MDETLELQGALQALTGTDLSAQGAANLLLQRVRQGQGLPGAGGGAEAHEAASDPHPQYQTAAEVEALISAVVDAAPDALDTLNELAAALGDDADFVGTVTTALTGKAATGHNHDAAYAPTHSHPYAATTHGHVDADIPPTIARDSEVVSAISAHAVLADPHPGYLTAAEGTAAYAPLGAATGGVIRKTANQTMTLTAQTAVADMSFPVAANATYYFRMDLVVTTSTGTAPTTAWGITGPASPTSVSIVAEIDTSTSVETSAVLTTLGNFAAGAQVANTGAKFQGTIQTGAATGTVELTAARGGTTPSMVVAAGSNGMWVRLA